MCREGLHEVPVRAGADACRGGFVARACRKKQHGYVPRAQVSAQLAHEGDAVHSRHHDIAEDEVRLAFAHGYQSAISVGSERDRIRFAQDARQVVAQIRIVVNREYAQTPGGHRTISKGGRLRPYLGLAQIQIGDEG